MKKIILSMVSVLIFCGGAEAFSPMPEYSPKSSTFIADNREFVMLEGSKNGFLIMEKGSSVKGTEDIEETELTALLPQTMREYVQNAYIIDESTLNKFKGTIGRNDSMADNGNWRVLSAREGAADTALYKEEKKIKYDEDILWGSVLLNSQKAVSKADMNEQIIEFIAEEYGEYKIDFLGDLKVKLTTCKKSDWFDTLVLKRASEDFSLSVDLDEGERVYLHIYPHTDDKEFTYKINGNSFCDCDISSQGWWIDTSDGCKVVSMYDGEILNSTGNEEYIRGVYKISGDYFLNNRIDIEKTGNKVFSLLRENLGRGEFNIYNDFEIETIFKKGAEGLLITPLAYTNENDEECDSFTSGKLNAGVMLDNDTYGVKNGVFYIAAYKDEKLVSILGREFSVPEKTSKEITGEIVIPDGVTEIRSFVWEDKITPVSNIQKRAMYEACLTDVTKNNMGNWSFYKKAKGATDFSGYTEMVFTDNAKIGNAPYISWLTKYGGYYPYVWVEADSKTVTEGQGSAAVCFTVPYAGNWEIDLRYRNVGTDVLGGTSGVISLSYLPKDSTEDNNIFKSANTGISYADPLWDNLKEVIYAEGGDRIIMTVEPVIDSYANRWGIDYHIRETEEKGRVIYNGYGDDVRSKPMGIETDAKELEDNIVWIGMSQQADKLSMQKTILYLKKYIPNLGVILMQSYPEDNSNADFFETNGIPTIIQSYGTSYADYITENDAWEYDWFGKKLDENNTSGADGNAYGLSGTGHAFAMPHSATKEAFGRLIKSTAEKGYTAYGYPDCVWDWGAYGKAAYNPQTIKAFSDDLCGIDEGIVINGEKTGFWDYYSYYFGGIDIEAGDFGFESWADYSPLTYEEYKIKSKKGENTDRYYMLLDMLCHYEFLKFVSFIGDTSKDNGIASQIMINAEFYANGVDILFLNRLGNVSMTDEEFFGDTSILDGAYLRRDYYIKDAERNGIKAGGVTEAGGGGNAGAYYEPEIAYALAFELGLLGTVEHLEADFLYNNRMELTSTNSAMRTRNEQILSYAMGFGDGKGIGTQKRPADFVSVSSRVHLMPWRIDGSYKPWYELHYDDNEEMLLSKLGYNFSGISQEGMPENAKLLVFTPKAVTQKHFDELLEKVEKGNISNVIMYPVHYSESIMPDITVTDFHAKNPDYSYTSAGENVKSGLLKISGGYLEGSKRFNISGKLYEKKNKDEIVVSFKAFSGEYPLVVKRKVGNGNIYLILFDTKSNYEVAELVYDYLFSSFGIEPMFKSISNTGALTAEYTATEEYTKKVSADYGATARVYENDDITVVTVWNSLGRFMAEKDGGEMTPYMLDNAFTSIKVKMKADTTYNYVTLLSESSGSVTSDGKGYVTLSFDGASYESFILAENTDNLPDTKGKIDLWKEAIEFNIQ